MRQGDWRAVGSQGGTCLQYEHRINGGLERWKSWNAQFWQLNWVDWAFLPPACSFQERNSGTRVEGTGLVTMAGKCHWGKAALPTNCFARDGWPPADVSYPAKKTKTWFLRSHCQRQPQHTRPSCCSSDCGVGNYTSASAHPISLSTAWGDTGNSKSIIIWAIKHKRRTNRAIIPGLRMQCENKECHFYSTSPAVR